MSFVLLDVLKNVKLPESILNSGKVYAITVEAPENNRSRVCTVTATDAAGNRVWSCGLPDYIIDNLLSEYFQIVFNALTGSAKTRQFTDLIKVLTNLDKSRYTYKDGLALANPQGANENNDPNRPQPDGDTPQLQPGGLVEQPLATLRRVGNWEFTNGIPRWRPAAQGEPAVPDPGPRPPRNAPVRRLIQERFLNPDPNRFGGFAEVPNPPDIPDERGNLDFFDGPEE